MEASADYPSLMPQVEGGPRRAPSLTVTVSIRFTDPIIRSRYSHTYTSSPALEATDRICHGLLRRLDHCSRELITRKDSAALVPVNPISLAQKRMRYEMHYRIYRRRMNAVGESAVQTFRSYQKQPLTVDAARQVVDACHRIVTLYFRRHDKGFHVGDGVQLARSPFAEASDAPDFEPGYVLEVSLRDPSGRRASHLAHWKMEVQSQQTAPLHPAAIRDVLEKGLLQVRLSLGACVRNPKNTTNVHGPNYTRDVEGVEIVLRAMNRLEPASDHLHQSFTSNNDIFDNVDSPAFRTFIRGVEDFMKQARDRLDQELNELDDLRLEVTKLQGWGWTVENPADLKFSSNSSHAYSRQTIEAALRRVQNGIGDVLRDHQVALRLIARERGQLILDKAFVAREKGGKSRGYVENPKELQVNLVSRLKARIQQDLDAVYKDTCSIDDIEETAPSGLLRDIAPAAQIRAWVQSEPNPSAPRRTVAPSRGQTVPTTSSMEPFRRPATSASATTSRRTFSLARFPRLPSTLRTEVVHTDSVDSTCSAPLSLPRPTTADVLTLTGLTDERNVNRSIEDRTMDGEQGTRSPHKSRTPLFVSATLKAAKKSLSAVRRKNRELGPNQDRPTSSSSSPVSPAARSRADGTPLAGDGSAQALDESPTAARSRRIEERKLSDADARPVTPGRLGLFSRKKSQALRKVAQEVQSKPDTANDATLKLSGPGEAEQRMFPLAPVTIQSDGEILVVTSVEVGNALAETGLREDSGGNKQAGKRNLSSSGVRDSKFLEDAKIASTFMDSEQESPVPSTPGLSTGAESSPRNSLLATPPRNLSGTLKNKAGGDSVKSLVGVRLGSLDPAVPSFRDVSSPQLGPADAGEQALREQDSTSLTTLATSGPSCARLESRGSDAKRVSEPVEGVGRTWDVAEQADAGPTTSMKCAVSADEQGQDAGKRVNPTAPGDRANSSGVESGLKIDGPGNASVATPPSSVPSDSSSSKTYALEPPGAAVASPEVVANVRTRAETNEPGSAGTRSHQHSSPDHQETLQAEKTAGPGSERSFSLPDGSEVEKAEPELEGLSHDVPQISAQPEVSTVSIVPTLPKDDLPVPPPSVPSDWSLPSESSVSQLAIATARDDSFISAPRLNPLRNPIFLGRSPSLISLLSRRSVSDMLSAYSGARSTFGPSSRELVDSLPPTRRELADGQRAQALGPSTAPQHRPQTAGYLGLHETRLVDVGLGGALTGSRRFGMPLQNMYILGNEEPGGCQRRSSAGLVEAPSSQVVSRKSHRAGELKRKNSRRSKSTSDAWTAMAASSTSQRGAGDGSEMDVAAGGKAEEPAVLPRVLMAFGAVAVASQLWPRSAA